MRKFVMPIFLFSVLLISISLSADAGKETKKKEEKNDSFMVKLVDGSQIVSKLSLEKLNLKASFADVDIPVEKIEKIKLNAKDNKASVSFLNGDNLQGNLKHETLNVNTLLGDLTIKIKDVTEICTMLKKEPEYNDSPQARMRCINNMRIMDAAKEQWAMAANKRDGDAIDINEVNQYIKGARTPICPAGGTYKYNLIGEDPECSCPGHKFPY